MSGKHFEIAALCVLVTLGAEKPEKQLSVLDIPNICKNEIKTTQAQVIQAENYVSKYHEPIVYGKYKGMLHARIKENLRLFYLYNKDTKTLT